MDDLRRLRHDIRGRLNAIRLCIMAFEVVNDQSEQFELLDGVESSATELVGLLDELERLPATAAGEE